MPKFHIVVAMDARRGIGKNGQLPWRLSADLKHFKEVTLQTARAGHQNVVIMGRKTWDSLPDKFKPLPGRVNVVISANPSLNFPEGVLKASSVDEALTVFYPKGSPDIDQIFVIGGGRVFEEAIGHSDCNSLYVTHLKQSYNCDTFFPPFEGDFELKQKSPTATENSIDYYFATYQKKS